MTSLTASVRPHLLSRIEVMRGLRISIWEAIWATIWAVLTTGAFQTGFALQIGATPFALGLLAGLPAAVNLLQLPASLYVEQRGERRTFVGASSILGRLIWLPILLVPFLLPHAAQLAAFLVLLTISSALLSVVVPAWTSWMSDLVPAPSRGQYFARRNMLAGIVSMVVPVPAGAFLDQAVKYGRFDPRLGFAVLFAIACLAAVGSFLCILRQPEPPVARPDGGRRANPLRSLSAPLADRQFRPFLIFSAMVVCGQALAGQFFTAWQVDKAALNLPYLTVQVLGVVASAAGLATTPIWGYLSDKYGNRPVLAIGAAGTIVAPLLWCCTEPGALYLDIALIVLLNLFSGAFWAGLGLAQFNLLLDVAAPANRSTYVAMYSATTGVIGFAAPIVGGVLMAVLAPVAFTVGPVGVNNYKLLFLLTALIRIACVFLLTRIRVEEGQSTRYVIEQLISARPMTSYLKARRLARPAAEMERRQTVEDLAELRSPLAVEELVAALDDVSLEVRERAARALGAIADPRAIPALAAKINDLAAGVGELAADALGEIGNREATPYLVAALSGPDAGVKTAAIKALTRITDPDAVPALIGALNASHPTACEAACVALAAIGLASREQAEVALPRLLYLLSPEVDRGMRFAAARALAAVAPQVATLPNSYETLRIRIAGEEDPSVLAQEAIALGRTGRDAQRDTAELLAVLLPVLDRTGTQGLAYKQALGAVADLTLPPGSLYPYLGLSEMARDETVSRLLEDLRRKSQRGSVDDHSVEEHFARALEAYSSSDHATFLNLLRPFAPTAGDAAAVFIRLHQRATTGYGTPEESLLALLLLRNT